jgi:CheY-like chemotaxis protein
MMIGRGIFDRCHLSRRSTVAKVLVIEDEANIRTLTEMLLKLLGHEVLLADNGWKGLELYRREHPDVIVLDLIMPGMDGIEVLRQIRSVDLHQRVIVVTADSRPKREWEVRALGVSEFLVKGSSVHSLGDTLKRLPKTPIPVIYTPAS